MAYMNLLKFHSVQLPPMNCKIVLNEEKASYTAGDTITGELIISVQKELYSFGLKVSLEGTALVKFKDQGIQSKSSSLLETFTYVYGKGDQKIRLQPGDHAFPFSLEFPTMSALPGSFRSPFGLILYQLVAYVQLEWKSIRKSEKTIKVSDYLNLSQFPSLTTPISIEKCEKFLLPSILSRGRGGQYKFTFKIPQSGFVCGEDIPFEFELDNPTGYEIAVIQVTLIQKVLYNGGSSVHLVQPGAASKVKLKVISRIQTNQMDSPTATCWKDALHVPQGTPPNQNLSEKSVIQICYLIKVEVKTNGQACPLRGEIPITIGTTREPFETKVDGGKSVTFGGLKVTHKSRADRSPSPCPRSRSARACHKSLERANSAASPPTSHSHPPRYSQLSVRSNSVETLPPAYEESLSKAIKTVEIDSEDEEPSEISEFIKGSVDEDEDTEPEEDEIEVESEIPAPDVETLPVLTTENTIENVADAAALSVLNAAINDVTEVSANSASAPESA